MYMSLELYTHPGQEICAALGAAYAAVWAIVNYLPTFVPPFNILIAAIMAVVVFAIAYNILMSISFGLTMDEPAEVDGNYITVIARRHKAGSNLGLWDFRYGIVEARARSHAFRENEGVVGEEETIDPTLFSDLWSAVVSLFGGGDWDWGFFDTRLHLFETELVGVH